MYKKRFNLAGQGKRKLCAPSDELVDKSAVENLTESLHTDTPALETVALETPKEETAENITALSPAEQAEQEEIELDDKLAYYINQYDPDNPLPANSENAHSEKTEQSSNKS